MQRKSLIRYKDDKTMRTSTLLLIAALLVAGLSCSGDRTSVAPEPAGTGLPGERSHVSAGVLPYVGSEFPSDAALSSYDWPEYLPSLYDTSYDIYALTLVWGYTYNGAAYNPDTTDWTGTLHTNFEGYVEVFSAISFEPGIDSVIPVDAPVWAPWISKTTGDDFDGLTFIVFFKRGLEYFDAPRVTIETVPFATEILVAELASLTAFTRIDEYNGVIVHSHRLPLANICPRGTIVGRWVQDPNNRGNGTISAVWGSREGVPLGHVIGSFATANDGSRTLSGWVTGIYTDQIIAWLEGSWWYDDYRECALCGESHGAFDGTFEWADGSGMGGRIAGSFGDFTLPPSETDLPLIGIWKADCTMHNNVALTEKQYNVK